MSKQNSKKHVGSRTKLDWSKHKLNIGNDGSGRFWELKIPNKHTYSVKFRTVDGITLITGDFYNWMLYRPFEPSATDEKVSDSYWCEKIRISSYQASHQFCSDRSDELIDELVAEMESEGSHNKEDIESIKDAKEHSSTEWELAMYIYDTVLPIIEEHEYAFGLIGKIINPSLSAIFDAFEEICFRLKELEESKVTCKTCGVEEVHISRQCPDCGGDICTVCDSGVGTVCCNCEEQG